MTAIPSGSAYPADGVLPPADTVTEVLLIRHGESEEIPDGADIPWLGRYADLALSDEGRRQAECLAERLAGAGVEAIGVTPLRRTQQTAAPLAGRLGLATELVSELAEVHLGEWEGRYRQRVAQRDPLVERVWAAERWDLIPGAEPAGVLAARVRRGVAALVAAHPGQRLAMFTHGGVIAQALADAARSRPFAFLPVANTAISRLLVAGDRWLVRSYNDTAHLADQGPGKRR